MIPFGSNSCLMPRIERHEVAVLAARGSRACRSRCRARRCTCRRARARPRRRAAFSASACAIEPASSGSSRNATWKLPSPTWPTMPPRSPDSSSARRACSIAAASSDTGTATSVVIAFEPGASARDAMSALCRALHICARAVGSLSDSNAVAPSSSASSRVVARSPATPASVPPNSTKRYGDSGKSVPLERVQRRDRRRVEQLAARDGHARRR